MSVTKRTWKVPEEGHKFLSLLLSVGESLRLLQFSAEGHRALESRLVEADNNQELLENFGYKRLAPPGRDDV